MISDDDYPDAKYFMEAYFHQNWIDFQNTYEDLADAFVREDEPERIARVRADMDRLLSLPVDASVLTGWLAKVADGYSPDDIDGCSLLELFRDRIARSMS